MKNLIIFILSTFLITSCIKKAENQNAGANRSNTQVQSGNQNTTPANQTTNTNSSNTSTVPASASRRAGQNINTQANYFKELKKALGIDNKKMTKLMAISEKYQPQIKENKNNTSKLNNLRESRGREFAIVLSPEQMEQKKYVDAVIYGYVGKSPAHPVNLKKSLGVSDGKILEYLAIQGTYNATKKRLKSNGQLSESKLGELIKARNESLSKVFSESEFENYRRIMKQAYGSK